MHRPVSHPDLPVSWKPSNVLEAHEAWHIITAIGHMWLLSRQPCDVLPPGGLSAVAWHKKLSAAKADKHSILAPAPA